MGNQPSILTTLRENGSKRTKRARIVFFHRNYLFSLLTELAYKVLSLISGAGTNYVKEQ